MDHSNDVLAELARELRYLREERERHGSAERLAPRGLKEAATEMGIGLTQLREHIRRGHVLTCQGSDRLVPVSEIERFKAPRKPTPKVSRAGRTSRKSDGRGAGTRIRALAKDDD
jgi:hypothetical protein